MVAHKQKVHNETQDGQCTYTVIFRRVCVTNVAVEKQ